MEYLVAVEIVNESCMSCLNDFNSISSLKIIVTDQTRETFLDFFNEEVNFLLAFYLAFY